MEGELLVFDLTSLEPQPSADLSSDKRSGIITLSFEDAPLWSETPHADDEARTHRKRGPKRGRGDGQQSKRQKELSDVDLEEEVAYAVGLDAYGMNEHEAGLLADDLDEEAYFQVRNHILARWRADVSHFLSEDEAACKILPKHRHLVSTAWQYLDRHGLINWGVAPAIMARPSQGHQETVVVIGAGLAGLSAARQLQNHGYKVVVVEGNDRPGGRVFTQRLQGVDGQAAVADLGGSIITGIDGNPLAVLARQLDIPMHDINSNDVPLYLRDGSQLDQGVDMQVEHAFNKLLDRSAALRDQLGPGGDAVSLQSSLDGLWSREEAAIQRQERQQQQQQQQQGQEQLGLQQGLSAAQTAASLQGSAAAANQPRCSSASGANGLLDSGVLGLNGQQHSHSADSREQQQQQQDGLLQPSAHHQQQQQQDRLLHPQPNAQQQQQGQVQQAAAALGTQFSPDQARRLLMQWHLANIEFANATRLRCLSMRHWDLDDEHEHQGAHVFLPGGNLRLLEGLAQGIPIFYKAPARLLQYSSSGVLVHTDAGVFAADAALVTIPLGVLKRKDCMAFQPPLPGRKRAAIGRLGFGCLNKVMMLFPHCFWGEKDMFGHVRTDGRHRGLYYLFYAYNSISGGAVLAALVAGDAAIDFEQQRKEESVSEVMQLLRGIFGPQGVDVPDPLQVVCTRWGSDPMCYGSYSSVAVGSAGAADYDELAKPLGNRVFFAGEATTSRYPATMHGAFATGLREAANIMTAFAGQRGEEVRPKVPEADPAAAAAGQQLVRLSELLHQVFDRSAGGGPDDEFGVFSVVYGPPGSEQHDQALVAVNMAGLRGAAKHASVVVYTTLSRSQVEVLREVPGDEVRIGVLTGELGVKLVGRPLDSDALQLLEAIVEARGLQEVEGLE